MARASVHKGEWVRNTLAARVSQPTIESSIEVHRLYLALNPDGRVDDMYRELFGELADDYRQRLISQGIDPTTIPPHPRSKAARLLREANAAANDPTRKAMPKGKIQPRRSPIRE